MAVKLLVGWGAAPGPGAFLLALALTYLVHSLLWAGAAAALVRVRAASLGTRHLYWKLALFGPLLSTLLASAASGNVERHLGTRSYTREVSVPALLAEFTSGNQGSAGVAAASGEQARREGSARDRVGRAGIALIEGAVLLGLLRFIGSGLFLMKRLRSRTRIANTRLLRRLEHMRGRVVSRQVFLSESSEIGSPLVIGAGEICVPRALLSELSDAEVDTMLAHELAHVERADGVWFALAGLVQSVLWLHPLNHWISSQFRYSAELACDDRAVELTRNPLGLARALVQVATSAASARRLALAPMMARSDSALLPRLRRLTSASTSIDRQALGRSPRWGIAILAALGAALGGFNVQLAGARPAAQVLPTTSQRPHVALAHGVHGASLPNAEEQSKRMGALAQLEQQLATQLEAARARPNTTQEGSADEVRVLELSQRLRHVRETEAWLESTFTEEWAAWERLRD